MSDETPLRILTLEEAAKDLIDSGGVPALLDAAENVVICYALDGDMDRVIDALRRALDYEF